MRSSQELPREFVAVCRRRQVKLTRYVLVTSILRQQVFLFARDVRDGHRLRRVYRASSSRFGTGQQSGSNQTPLGLHYIAEKIGAGFPIGTVFQSRQPVGFTWQGRPNAAIAHRILWLSGLEPGLNQGDPVDSRRRYIYIHGLGDETSLGRPASRGCIHLAAADLLPLFDAVPTGTLVWIARQ